MSAPDTRVRVTLEGIAQQSVATASVMRVRLHNGVLVLIDKGWPDVQVETLQPAWDWSEGDVVAGEVIVYVRNHLGVWQGIGPAGLQYRLDDAMVSEGAGNPEGYDVLRYAKGGQ